MDNPTPLTLTTELYALGRDNVELIQKALEFVRRQYELLSYFKFDHLPPHLQNVSRPFSKLAQEVYVCAPEDPETYVALRKLLEAKDAAVRAALNKT